jgi:opacity protein-like surface antigen
MRLAHQVNPLITRATSMNKFLLLLLAVSAIELPPTAQGAPVPYAGFSSGVGLMNNWGQNNKKDVITFKPGIDVDAALGLKTGGTRLEVSLGYRHSAVESIMGAKMMNSGSNVDFWTFMANGCLDFERKGAIVIPYIMAGIGFADVVLNDDSGSQTHGTFAWQAGAGIGIEVSKKITLDLGYRYLSPSDITSESGSRYSMNSSAINAGMRYTL